MRQPLNRLWIPECLEKLHELVAVAHLQACGEPHVDGDGPADRGEVI